LNGNPSCLRANPGRLRRGYAGLMANIDGFCFEPTRFTTNPVLAWDGWELTLTSKIVSVLRKFWQVRSAIFARSLMQFRRQHGLRDRMGTATLLISVGLITRA